MSEIEFRLERTPVEESDDEVQHDEIPSGKCIAPIFDKKLKHFRAAEGVPVTFTCKVVGIPIPKVNTTSQHNVTLKMNESKSINMIIISPCTSSHQHHHILELCVFIVQKTLNLDLVFSYRSTGLRMENRF